MQLDMELGVFIIRLGDIMKENGMKVSGMEKD
jgi:hypothetical protein